MMRHRMLVAIVLFGAVHAAHGQSLADVADKEAARRKTISTSGRVYTNQDLPETAKPASAPASTTASEAATATPEAEASVKETGTVEPVRPAGNDKHWRQRASDYRRRLNEARGHVAAVEGRLETLRAEKQTPATAAEIALSEKDLRKFQRNLASAEKNWARLESDARAAGTAALLQE
ncbi:MAG TPA: hypothetical protein VJM31_13835 [Vicinamibacterales bacterium]|nr:hypothetical protein [Vicinamibacterales bacterium]